jgi:flagellar motility protein MotE (MotC chaperone)
MTKLLTSTWMTLPVSVLIYGLSTWLFWKTPPPAPRISTTALVAKEAGFNSYQNPEADQLVAELKDEKSKLDTREQQLNDLAARLDIERGEISNATLSVQQLQAEFDKNVMRVKNEETANLMKLAKVYAAMTPDGAAVIFADMEDATVAKILLFMKEDDAAAVLESLSKKGDAEAKRAAKLSEQLRVAAFRSNANQ